MSHMALTHGQGSQETGLDSDHCRGPGLAQHQDWGKSMTMLSPVGALFAFLPLQPYLALLQVPGLGTQTGLNRKRMKDPRSLAQGLCNLSRAWYLPPAHTFTSSGPDLAEVLQASTPSLDLELGLIF